MSKSIAASEWLPDLRDPHSAWRDVDFIRGIYDALGIEYNRNAPLSAPFPHPSAALIAIDRLNASAAKVDEMRQLMCDVNEKLRDFDVLVPGRFLAYCNDSEDAV
jgi:hypothetical protein